jgi:hypothetical protein
MAVNIELIGGIVGMVLTLLILSYLFFGDNPLYRLALYILIGGTVGYALAVATVTVLLPELFALNEGNAVELALPVILGILLLFKAFPRLATVGNFSTAFLVGVGAAVAIVGALLGTIFPQATAAGSILEWQSPLEAMVGIVVALGTALSLVAFTFTVRRPQQGPQAQSIVTTLLNIASRLGRIFLIAAFGATFAGALIASFSIFIGRINILVDGVLMLLQLFLG